MSFNLVGSWQPYDLPNSQQGLSVAAFPFVTNSAPVDDFKQERKSAVPNYVFSNRLKRVAFADDVLAALLLLFLFILGIFAVFAIFFRFPAFGLVVCGEDGDQIRAVTAASAVFLFVSYILSIRRIQCFISRQISDEDF